MLTPDQDNAVRLLIAHATASTTPTTATSGTRVAQLIRRWTDGIRSERDQERIVEAGAGTRWEDSASYERPGWTARSAYVAGFDEPVFEVDVQVCHACEIGWVEQPYTPPQFQRRGLATAGLASLRRDHPGARSWHTLGGHLSDSRRLWAVAGADVPGGYLPRDLCPHVQQ